MIAANPGNIVKFNTSRDFLRHRQRGTDRTPFGIRCPQHRLIPFMMYVETVGTSASWKLVNPATDAETVMTAGDLEMAERDGGGLWVWWDGLSDLTTIPDCGFYEIHLTINSQVYYSEVIQVYEASGPVADWRLYFDNTTDKGPVLYQQSYRQYFYPTTWAWDRPVTEREREIRVDGNNKEVTRFSRTVTRFRLEIPDIPDYCLPFFAKCGDMETVIFQRGVVGPDVIMTNTDFESRAQGVGLNVGIFSFDAETEAFNGCQENYIMA